MPGQAFNESIIISADMEKAAVLQFLGISVLRSVLAERGSIVVDYSEDRRMCLSNTI